MRQEKKHTVKNLDVCVKKRLLNMIFKEIQKDMCSKIGELIFLSATRLYIVLLYNTNKTVQNF